MDLSAILGKLTTLVPLLSSILSIFKRMLVMLNIMSGSEDEQPAEENPEITD